MWYNVVRTKDVLWWIYLWPLFSIDFALYTVALLCIALHCIALCSVSSRTYTLQCMIHSLTYSLTGLMI